MKIIFLSALNLIFMVHVSVDAENQFDRFLVYFFYDTPEIYHLPLNYIPSIGDENIKVLCPAETEQDKRNIDILSATFPQAKYCLFRKISFHLCTEQPKPWLELQQQYADDETPSCGTLPEHKEFRIGFYFCGNSLLLEDFREIPYEPDLVARFQKALDLRKSGDDVLPQFYNIYNLCIDTSNGKTIWTKHEIMTPAMFTDTEAKLQRESGGDIEISTDPILFEANTFTNFKQKFQSQNEESFKMTENFMVPREHVAMRVWRNAVNHFINVAPLWDKLEKLMLAVNQAIKEIAIQLYINNHIQLTVHTAAIDSKDEDEKIIQVNSQFSSTVWYKLLYNNGSNAAALIVLHNTPNTPPKIKACETEMVCDVKKWYEKKQDDDEGISDEVFEYVYCCYPTASEALKLFNFELIISGPLNLDDFF